MFGTLFMLVEDPSWWYWISMLLGSCSRWTSRGKACLNRHARHSQAIFFIKMITALPIVSDSSLFLEQKGVTLLYQHPLSIDCNPESVYGMSYSVLRNPKLSNNNTIRNWESGFTPRVTPTGRQNPAKLDWRYAASYGGNRVSSCTVYPKKYAHGFCFAVLCCGYTLTDFPISIRPTSLVLWQSNDCPSASKATLMNMDKYFMRIQHQRLHNHNKAKHNKTVCIFLGIYCRSPSLLRGCWHCSIYSKRDSTWFDINIANYK